MKKTVLFLLLFASINLFAQGKIIKFGPSGLFNGGNGLVINYGLEFGGERQFSERWSWGANLSYFKSAKYKTSKFVSTSPTSFFFTFKEITMADELFGIEPYIRRYGTSFEDGSFWGLGLNFSSLTLRNYTEVFGDTKNTERLFSVAFGNRTKMTERIYCDQLFTLGIGGDSNIYPVSFKLSCLFGLKR